MTGPNTDFGVIGVAGVAAGCLPKYDDELDWLNDGLVGDGVPNEGAPNTEGVPKIGGERAPEPLDGDASGVVDRAEPLNEPNAELVAVSPPNAPVGFEGEEEKEVEEPKAEFDPPNAPNPEAGFDGDAGVESCGDGVVEPCPKTDVVPFA